MKEKLLSLLKVSRLQLGVAAGLFVAAVLYIFRLGSAPAHMSQGEFATYHNNFHLHQILRNPLNAPYKLIDYAMLHIFGHTVAAARLTSVVFALIAVVLFFNIMLRWHGKRTAWLATFLFATSGWLLHVGRLGTGAVTWVVLPLALILLGSWLSRTEKSGWAMIILALSFGIILFVPAAIWFVVVYALLLRQDIGEHMKESEHAQRIIAAIIFLVLVGALAFSLYSSPDLVRPWLGLPHMMPHLVNGVHVWISSLLLYLFARGPYSPEIWLGHAPILDVFVTAMFLLGAYFYITHFRNLRAFTLATFTIIGSVLTALNGALAMSFLVPLAYLIAATGLTYLLREWMTVFPRNPVARTVGVALVTLAVASTAAYHLTSYFVAWQHNPATVRTFQRKP